MENNKYRKIICKWAMASMANCAITRGNIPIIFIKSLWTSHPKSYENHIQNHQGLWCLRCLNLVAFIVPLSPWDCFTNPEERRHRGNQTRNVESCGCPRILNFFSASNSFPCNSIAGSLVKVPFQCLPKSSQGRHRHAQGDDASKFMVFIF
jgi:hypothetical protein